MNRWSNQEGIGRDEKASRGVSYNTFNANANASIAQMGADANKAMELVEKYAEVDEEDYNKEELDNYIKGLNDFIYGDFTAKMGKDGRISYINKAGMEISQGDLGKIINKPPQKINQGLTLSKKTKELPTSTVIEQLPNGMIKKIPPQQAKDNIYRYFLLNNQSQLISDQKEMMETLEDSGWYDQINQSTDATEKEKERMRVQMATDKLKEVYYNKKMDGVDFSINTDIESKENRANQEKGRYAKGELRRS